MTSPKNARSRTARRQFVKLCVSAVALGAHRAALATPEGTGRKYRRALLIDHRNRPIRAADIVAGENYVFHYPYISTPCFLLDLGEALTRKIELNTEAGTPYQWQGGVGPSSSIVAFSAICAHKMTHPARAVSFINYRHEKVRFENHREQQQEASKVIYCCSERSVYDVRNGARVVGGPAKQPLAAVMLEYVAERDELYAVGTYGGEMFEKFFATFAARLQLEYRTTDIARQVAGRTELVPLDEYCSTQILC